MTNPAPRVAILTVSDRAHRQDYADETGPDIVRHLQSHSFSVAATALVPDERVDIRGALETWIADPEIDIILTNGGTGLAPRDITPDVTAQLIERAVPGIPEMMRSAGRANTPFAALSRQVAGITNETLIINLPGSPKGALESLASIEDVLSHAASLIKNDAAPHE